MIFYKYNWAICSQNWDTTLSQSEYDKSTITYDTIIKTPITEDNEVEHTVVDAYGKTIILGTKTIQVPVMETVKVKELNDEGKEHTVTKEQPLVKEEIVQVRYNPYDEQWAVIIPDDATIISEEEYNKEIENMTIFKDIK